MTLLGVFENRGFQPQATALILNLGKAENFDAKLFGPTRRHPAYQKAIDRGAVELWMPGLFPAELAARIENKLLHFHDARDGGVPEGVLVRQWMEDMAKELQPVETWMPWA
jgi:hypothetical protein